MYYFIFISSFFPWDKDLSPLMQNLTFLLLNYLTWNIKTTNLSLASE